MQQPSFRPMPAAGESRCRMTMTEILAVIGGMTLVLTAATRIPTALAEFLRAWIAVAIAARELRAALTKRTLDDPSKRETLICSSAQDSQH